MSPLIDPMIAQAGLILLVGLWLIWARMGSVVRGKIDLKDVIAAGAWPAGWVRQAGDNFNHQFELPMLFFVTGFLLVHLSAETPLTVGLAWSFVALRALHSVIHLSFNHIPTRFFVFLAGFFVVGGMIVVGLIEAFL